MCTAGLAGLYSNIPYDEGLASLNGLLNIRVYKQVTKDILIELVELVLENNIFEFDEKTYKK